MVEKPGESIHSKKWDDCVEHVKANNSGANAYAVCTAMLGEDAFKSMEGPEFLAKVDEFIHRLNITDGIKEKAVTTGDAGPIPNSLLARQDLEGKKRKSTVPPESDYQLETNEQRREGQFDGAKYKGMSEDITEERTGEEHYRDLSDTYSDMADDEARHRANLESMKARLKKTGSDHEMTIEIHNGSEFESSSDMSKAQEVLKDALANPAAYEFVALGEPVVAGDGFSYTDLALRSLGPDSLVRIYGVPLASAKAIQNVVKAADSTVYVAFTDEEGNEQERAFMTQADAEAFMVNLEALDCYTSISMQFGKGAVDTARKELIDAAMEDTDASKKTIAARIKAAQQKIQRSTIVARERAGDAVGKSFKDVWTKR